MRFSVCFVYNYLEYNALRRLPDKIPRFQRAASLFHKLAEPVWTRFRVFSRVAVMGIEVRVCLIDLKRAFRRLIARLPDESEAGADFIVFKADADHLEIVSGGTSETLRASVAYPG